MKEEKMKERVISWIKRHKRSSSILATVIVALTTLSLVLPVHAQALEYLDVTGTYLVQSSAVPRYTDGARHGTVKFNRLIITTQSGKAITVATLEHMGTDIDLDGIVGPGTKPNIYLYGTDSDGSFVHINGKVLSRSGTVTGISGRITGLITSDGSRWDDSADGTSEISVAAYYSEPLSCLINGGTDANPKTILFHKPATRLKLKQLTTLKAGQLGFWFNLENAKGPGPQMMLRFAPADSTTQTYYGGGTSGLVDISIMPYQGYTGTGNWVECSLTKDSGIAIYYGNDPTDYTSFGGTPITTIAELEAAINAETAMVAGGDSASDWVLTMVSVELWEAGDRDLYVDDVTIGGTKYTLEPNSYNSSFRATKQ